MKQVRGQAALWRKVFGEWRPTAVVIQRMASRYLDWSAVYESERKHVLAGETMLKQSNGVVGIDPHLKAMQVAETEMRRLWKQLEPHLKTQGNVSIDDDLDREDE